LCHLGSPRHPIYNITTHELIFSHLNSDFKTIHADKLIES
jgi:hypothetical protein